MQQFERGYGDTEQQRRDDHRELKADRASCAAVAATVLGLLSQLIGAVVTVVVVAISATVKTRVHTDGPFNSQKIGVAKACVDTLGFAFLLLTSICTCVIHRRGMVGTWGNIPIFSVFGLANIAMSALTFLAINQDGVDGIVGLKEPADSTRFGFWHGKKNRRHYSNGDGTYFYNNDTTRNNIMNGWKASGAFEGIFGVLYMTVVICMLFNQWYNRKN